MTFIPSQIQEYVAVIRVSTAGSSVGDRTWAGSWVAEPRLIPLTYTKSAYGAGKATFNLIPKVYNAGAGWIEGNEINSGSYIGISTITDGVLSDPVWSGYITSMPEVQFKSSGQSMGAVGASRLGDMLSQIPLQIFAVKKNVGIGIAISHERIAPQANYATQSGDIIGNRVLDDNGVSVFSNDALLCGTTDSNYWTRKQLAEHVLTYSLPIGIPDIAIEYIGNASTVAADVVRETYELNGVTLRGCLDILFSRQRGLTWDMEAVGDVWTVTVRQTYDAGQAAEVDLSDVSRDSVKELTIHNNAGTQYDEIVVEGHPVVWMGTIENGNANEAQPPVYFRAGWTETQENLYISADDAERKNSTYDNVFQRWIVLDPVGGDGFFTQEDADGLGSPVYFCQRLEWDFGTEAVTVNDQWDTAPYGPTARISRTTPWAIGFGETTDTRDTLQKTNPIYAPPMMFNRFEGNVVYVNDTTAAGENVYVDDRGLAFRIRAAYGHAYSEEEQSPTRFDTVDEPSLYYWQANAFTFSVDSAQILKVSALRNSDVANNPIRKTLIIKGDWHVWACHQGAIVGVEGEEDNQTPIRTVTSGAYATDVLTAGKTFLLRNDYPAAVAALEEAQTWAFRETKSGTLTFTDLGVHDLFSIGQSISNIVDTDSPSDVLTEVAAQSVTHEINAGIETIAVSLSIDKPAITIAFGSKDSVSSPAITVVNASQSPRVTNISNKIQFIEQQMQAIPVSSAKGGGSAASTTPDTYQVIDGQTIPPANSLGILYQDSVITLSIQDPDVGGTRPDGIGRIRNLRTGDYSMCLHDDSAPYGAQTAMIGSDLGVVVGSKTFTDGGNSTTYYYLARF